MRLHLHTDIGHDPDDVIALCYLIENGFVPTSVSISPGYFKQIDIVYSIFEQYEIDTPPVYCSKSYTVIPSEKECKYQPGPHKVLTSRRTISPKDRAIPEILCDSALVIGPALNLGGKLKCNTMVFQGGFSPNSDPPLEKFKGQMSAQSFNPSGAKSDFLLLRDSGDIKRKYYVGKNVCHGFTKKDLGWAPKPPALRAFFDKLSDSKAMHDVLAAKMLIDPTAGKWEYARPIFVSGLQMTTEESISYSNMEINTFKSLV